MGKWLETIILSLGIGLTGCSLPQRVDRFTTGFAQNFEREYRERTNPNVVNQDRYSSLRKLGELQRRISQGLLTRSEALQYVDQSDYDQAFDAVQSIARSAAQDAFKQSTPEVRVVEQFTTLDVTRQSQTDITDVFSPQIRLNTSLSDFVNPRLNLSSSFTKGKIELTPGIRFGRLYSLSYSTKDEEFNHDFRYQYHEWMFRAEVRHDLHQIKKAGASVSYALNLNAAITFTYTYLKPEENHTVQLGFGWSF